MSSLASARNAIICCFAAAASAFSRCLFAGCRTLLDLYEDETRESAQVKAVAQEHLAAVDEKIAQLKSMRETLAHLVDACQGDHRPDCPILKDLAKDP